MKKFFIFSMFAAMIMAALFVASSCSNAPKEEANKVGDYILVKQDGKYGLKDGFNTVLEAVYDNVSIHKTLGVVVASKDGLLTIVDATPRIEGVRKVEPAEAGYSYLYVPDGMYILKNGTTTTWGSFAEIKMVGTYLFFKSDQGWGAATIDHKGLAPRRFEKVYILENDKQKKMVVVAKDSTGWRMYDKDGVTDGVEYDTSSSEIVKALKPYDTSAPCGVLKVDMPL